jgi:hypothetical protein
MRRFRPVLLSMTLFAAPLLVLGCGDDDGGGAALPAADTEEATPDEGAGDDQSGAAAESGTRSGRVETDAGTYDFEPTTCAMEDDGAEMNGPGSDPDGGPVYVDIGVGEGFANLRIDVGTDQQFESSDDIINGDDFEYTLSGSSLSGTASLSDGNMQPLGEATVEVDCG